MGTSDELGKKFAETHPADAARILERATPDETAAFLDGIPTANAVDVLRHMNVRLAAAVLTAVEIEHAAAIVQSLPLNHAAQVLRHSDPATAEAVLGRVGEQVARPLKRSLRYREGTAAALADPEVLSLPSDMSVAEAQKQLRRSAGDVSYNVYVTDRDHRLVGVITIRELLLAGPKQTLESIMQRQLTRLTASADLASIALDPAWQEFDMLPVVDKAGMFLGVIRHKIIRRLAGERDAGTDVTTVIDVALGIADLYWKSLSGLAAGLAVAAGGSATPRGAGGEIDGS